MARRLRLVRAASQEFESFHSKATGVMADTIANLMASVRQQTRVAGARERRTTLLYGMSRELAATRGPDRITQVAIKHVAESFASDAAVLLPARVPPPDAEASESSPAPFPLRLRCGMLPIRAPPLTRLGRLLPCSGSSPAAATVSSEPPTFSTRGSAPAKAEPPVAPTGTNRLVQTRRSALPFVFYAPSTHPGPIAALQCVLQKRRQRQQLPHNPPQYAMETAGRRSRTRGANERHWLSR